MAKYTSRYKELAFYVGGQRKQFTNGTFDTDDKATTDVLDELKDVQKVAESKAEPKPTTTQKAKAPAKK